MMEQIQVLALKIDSEQNILEYNANFTNFFKLPQHNLVGESLINLPIVNDLFDERVLEYVRKTKKYSILLMRNHNITQGNNPKTALVMLYAHIRYEQDCYSIKITNFLNWLYNLTRSNEASYNTASYLNGHVKKKQFAKLSDATCFKALYPLLFHIPANYKVNNYAIYDTMRGFVGKKDNEAYEKDYSRKVFSRVKTTLKRDFGLIDVELIDLIRKDELINLRYNGDICMPYTVLLKNLTLPAQNDDFLNHMMNIIC